MGRNHNQMITYDDLVWMQNNDMLFARIPATGGNVCVNKGGLNGLYNNLDASLISSYANNQLVPYQKIQQLPVFTVEFLNNINYQGGSKSDTLFNYWGYDWSVSWKKYVYWEVPPYEGQYIEDTTGTWFNASPSSGNGEETITMTFDYNDSPSARYAIVTITSKGQPYDIIVYQNANPGVATNRVTVAWSDVGLQDSCEKYAVDQNLFYYYIEDGYGWAGAPKLYSNIEGTKLAPTGFYSNGQRARFWSLENEEFGVVGPNLVKSVACDTATPPDPDPVYDNNMITLARYQTTNSAENACSMFANNVTQMYYIPKDKTWSNTTVIYTDIDGNNTAVTGWYSDGVTARLWIKETGLFQSSASCS